jgi:hypothetical protein
MHDETSSRYLGGCLCGAVRYAATGTPPIEGNCHCRDCRRVSGSAYAPTLFFPVDAVEIAGEPAWYESTGGSGQPIRRGFCATCGTQLFGRPTLRAGMIGIRAGTLDDPAQYRPQADIFTAHAPSWDRMLDATAKFETAPSLPPA